MIESISVIELANQGALVLIAILVITNKLVWHTRLTEVTTQHGLQLTKVEEQRDRWEQIALRALGVADKMTVHAEVANEIVSKLPDPASVTE